jgi:chaperonin cofactor prefoldin
MAEQLFERWNTIKGEIRTLQKEEDIIKTRIKSAMSKINKNTLTTPSYHYKQWMYLLVVNHLLIDY